MFEDDTTTKVLHEMYKKEIDMHASLIDRYIPYMHAYIIAKK